MADAQPAISEPSTPTPITARTKNSPASTVCPDEAVAGRPGSRSAPGGTGSRATAGASWKTRRSAPAGTMSSFCANFTPSATSWAQPWKPPAYIGPSRPCMWAITLCSVWPTTSGRTRKTTRTATQPQRDVERVVHASSPRPSGGPSGAVPRSRAVVRGAGGRCGGRRGAAAGAAGVARRGRPPSALLGRVRRWPPSPRHAAGAAGGAFAGRGAAAAAPRRRRAGRAGTGGSWPLSGPHSLGSGTPGGSIWRRRLGPPSCGLPRFLGAGPRLGDPGGQDEVLAQRVALEAVRAAAAVTRCGWPVKSMPNISWVSRSCQSAPA